MARCDRERLRITRQRAHQLHRRAVEVLRHRDETRGLEERLEAIGAPVVAESECHAVGPTIPKGDSRIGVMEHPFVARLDGTSGNSPR
jgi:hypothetical protein